MKIKGLKTFFKKYSYFEKKGAPLVGYFSDMVLFRPAKNTDNVSNFVFFVLYFEKTVGDIIV